MWISQRVGKNTVLSTPVWPLVLVGFLAVGGTVAMVQMFVEMPLVLVLFGGGFAAMFTLYAVATHRTHGVWPWQPLPLDSEPVEELERGLSET